jgi:hypothetical protein
MFAIWKKNLANFATFSQKLKSLQDLKAKVEGH